LGPSFQNRTTRRAELQAAEAAMKPTTAQSAPPWSTSWQRWYTFTVMEPDMIRVELCRQGVCDADLRSLFRHLEMRLQTGRQLACALDLSDNPGITDQGVETHLMPFLRTWPQCHSLRLCRTSVSDKSLSLLADWMANSQVSEVDLSQVSGPITSRAVSNTVRVVVSGRRTTHKNKDIDVKLWLSLELNGLEETLDVGPHVNIWERNSEGWKRGAACKANKMPLVELALYPTSVKKSSDRGREIMSILGAQPSSRNSMSEPLALSTDEFNLYCMELREAAEVGADSKNCETFGQDAVAEGWSFERNMEANRLLTRPKLPQLPAKGQPILSTIPVDAAMQGTGGVIVDRTVRYLLQKTQILRVSDFKGNVREWLIAIYKTAGVPGVVQAAELIRAHVDGKQREDVSRWTGYLSKLLERFHAAHQPTIQLQ